MALIAMLATSDDGVRTRAWLQDRLWGSRQPEQARGSLRRELYDVREQLNVGTSILLGADRHRVWLDLSNIAVDTRDAFAAGPAGGGASREFLEGFDIPGEEGFEEWLREERRAFALRPTRSEPLELPARIVDVSQPAPGFAGQPALAVLPFVNQTGAAENDYLADGLSDDLIDRLVRLRWLPVIARNSSFTVRGSAIDHAAVGRLLGARYIFEGRLRRAGAGFSLAIELTDAATRRVLWSERLEQPDAMSAEVQAQIVAQLVGAIDTRIDHAQQLNARAATAHDMTVSDLIWRGRWHINRLTREDAARAREFFAQALELEPESPEALIQSAWALGRTIWAERRDESHIRAMRDLAQRAIRADPDDGRGHWLAGAAEMWLRRSDRAKELLLRAIRINPSLAEAHSVLGDAYTWNGEPELALQSLRTALRLNPTDLMVFAMLSNMATARWMQGALEDAVDLAEQSIIRRPGFWYAHAVKITALMELGETDRAAQAHQDLLAAKPRFDPVVVDWVAFIDRSWNDRLKRGLLEAAALAKAQHG